MRAASAAIVGKRLEEQLVHPAVGQHLRAAPRRNGQDHVQRGQLAIVATPQIAVAASDALMGIALGRAVVGHAQGLHASAQSEVAARDLRFRHGADPQQRSYRVQVGQQVVVAELRA